MSIIISLDSCTVPKPTEIIDLCKNMQPNKSCGLWDIGNELKPSDLFCYLYSKFGPPNGMQNFLRNDSSDNLIHWDWTLVHANGLIIFLGLNLRTEIQLIGNWDFPNCDKQQLVDFIKRDFLQYEKQMKEIRNKKFEDWDMIINPYKMMKDSINQLKKELDKLALNPLAEAVSNPQTMHDSQRFKALWDETTAKYNKGIGLSMAIRSMTPVLAESFINLLFFCLCRQDIKKNKRLYESAIRANIDIKVQSLHINCQGFLKEIQWSSKECGSYNTIVNERNDFLHGNVKVDKLKFSEIFFIGKVPIFKSYKDLWQRSIGVSIDASGFDKISDDLTTINLFVEYVLSCLEPKIKADIEHLINSPHIGVNKKNGQVAVLLPARIVDFRFTRVIEKNEKLP